MNKQSLLEHVGQYSVLVFQNDGADALAEFLQEHYFNAWSVDEGQVAQRLLSDEMDLIILDYYKKYKRSFPMRLITRSDFDGL